MSAGAADVWHDVITGRRDGFGPRCARLALATLSLPYRAAVGANLAVFEHRLLPRARLPCPVISVGNLTLGGTGKTSSAAFIARHLRRLGRHPAIILRGHAAGGRSSRVLAPGREPPSADEVGDEAAMLAASLADVPIGVGKWREGVGRELLANTPTDVVVLDDGFQYFRLARELDIVLVDALRPLGEQRLFPAGTLREPASHLRRAQAVWITHADLAPAAALAGVRGEVTALAPEAVVAVTRHRALTMRLLHNGREVEPASQIADARVLALSSIGNPLAFEMSLSRLGAREVVPLRFPDHHQYTGADAAAIAERASETGRVVTTEKDAVRLQPVTVGADVWVLRCELEILEGADRALSLIEGAVR